MPRRHPATAMVEPERFPHAGPPRRLGCEDVAVMQSVPTGDALGDFHAGSTRDGAVRARDGQAFHAINLIDARGVEAIAEILFGDGCWMLAARNDLELDHRVNTAVPSSVALAAVPPLLLRTGCRAASQKEAEQADAAFGVYGRLTRDIRVFSSLSLPLASLGVAPWAAAGREGREGREGRQCHRKRSFRLSHSLWSRCELSVTRSRLQSLT
jgi:hypothetical protein